MVFNFKRGMETSSCLCYLLAAGALCLGLIYWPLEAVIWWLCRRLCWCLGVIAALPPRGNADNAAGARAPSNHRP